MAANQYAFRVREAVSVHLEFTENCARYRAHFQAEAVNAKMPGELQPAPTNHSPCGGGRGWLPPRYRGRVNSVLPLAVKRALRFRGALFTSKTVDLVAL